MPELGTAISSARAGAIAILAVAALVALGKNLETFVASFARTVERSILPNWYGIVWPDYELIERLLIEEGLALAFVPEARILQRLLDAGSTAERRRIIDRKSVDIVADCCRVLETVTTDRVMSFRRYALAAAMAIQNGHHEAGQALATNTLDSLIRRFPRTNRDLITSHKRPFNPDNFGAMEVIILGGVYGAYGSYRPDSNDAVPFIFNRHASAHHVSRRQYSKRNATIALMHLTALTKAFDFAAKLD